MTAKIMTSRVQLMELPPACEVALDVEVSIELVEAIYDGIRAVLRQEKYALVQELDR